LDDAGTERDGKCLLERLHSLGFTHDATLEHMCVMLLLLMPVLLMLVLLLPLLLLLPPLTMIFSTRKDFQIEGVNPNLAIGAVALCHVLVNGYRVLYNRQGGIVSPMDSAIICSKYAALDAPAAAKAVQLFRAAGFPTVQNQFIVISNFWMCRLSENKVTRKSAPCPQKTRITKPETPNPVPQIHNSDKPTPNYQPKTIKPNSTTSNPKPQTPNPKPR